MPRDLEISERTETLVRFVELFSLSSGALLTALVLYLLLTKTPVIHQRFVRLLVLMQVIIERNSKIRTEHLRCTARQTPSFASFEWPNSH